MYVNHQIICTLHQTDNHASTYFIGQMLFRIQTSVKTLMKLL